jgi:hypothetical protein
VAGRRPGGRRGRARSGDGPGRVSGQADKEHTGGRLRRLLASPAGVIAGALTALFTALVVGVGQELVPKENLADLFRGGDPFSVTVATDVPQEAVPGAVARERLDSAESQQAIESMRAPFKEAIGKARLVPADQTTIYMQLTGQRSQPVNVIGMHIRVLKREAPLTGTLLLGPGPQGDSPNIVLQATVDDPSSKLVELVNGVPAQQPYFATRHVSVARGEAVPFALFTRAGHCYCEWDVAVDFVADGRQSVLYVGRNGIVHGDRDPRPFAISAVPPRIENYGVVYALPVEATTDFSYRRLSSDRYCEVVSAFYGSSDVEKGLSRWAC